MKASTSALTRRVARATPRRHGTRRQLGARPIRDAAYAIKGVLSAIAQEVQSVIPEAVRRGSDGYLRVYYDKLGLKFRTYRDWLSAGTKIPIGPSR